MTQAWVELTTVDGCDILMPTPVQLAAALGAVYRAVPLEDADASVAVLRFGYDDGLMYALEVASGGAITFEEWSDRDCELALAAPRRMAALSQDAALQLWTLLAQRQVAKIRAQPWA